MSFVHGKNTYVSISGVDLSPYTNASTFTRTVDLHDTTTYGKDDHVFAGGLGNATVTISGIYDSVSGGPRDTIEPLMGAGLVTFIRRPEGTGSGKAQDSVSVIVASYVETSPVADMVTWSAELQTSGAVTSTDQ